MAGGGGLMRHLLALVAVLFLAACQEDLHTGLDEGEANEIVAVLQDSGISASKRSAGKEGFAVTVERAQFAQAVDLLRRNGLPRPRFDTIGAVFKKEGLISSPVEERARFIYALSQELAQTVQLIDGVLSARIHVVLPENEPLRKDLKPSSASVFIRHRPEIGIDALVPQIKMLVANSIEGLSYDRVSVIAVAAPGGPALAAREPPLTRVAGLWVDPASAQPAMIGIGLLMVVAVGSIGLNVWQALRTRREQATGRELHLP